MGTDLLKKKSHKNNKSVSKLTSNVVDCLHLFHIIKNEMV